MGQTILETRKCKQCGEEKPLGSFVVVHNRSKVCAECRQANIREQNARKSKKQRSQPYFKEYRQRYQQEHREECREYARQYRRRHPEYAAHMVDRRTTDPVLQLRHFARVAVNMAVHRGILIKPDHCTCCRKPYPKRRIHAHHMNYYDQLNVVWLCPTCHNQWHWLKEARSTPCALRLTHGVIAEPKTPCTEFAKIKTPAIFAQDHRFVGYSAREFNELSRDSFLAEVEESQKLLREFMTKNTGI